MLFLAGTGSVATLDMFKKLFGAPSQPQGHQNNDVSASTTQKTVDAIQQLGDVSQDTRSVTGQQPNRCPLPGLQLLYSISIFQILLEEVQTLYLIASADVLEPCWVQQEELLVKRRGVLEKKIEAENEHAREYTRAKNKRGTDAVLLQLLQCCFLLPGH